ncbi:MAG: trehalose-phosphatase [Gemmatimonadetes bacterium]|nr:trehalose-phosphatase [Gemmatimonadota bacterium]NIO30228.1 trehalose-phosphatase [Gemmatimonadota bacterium]
MIEGHPEGDRLASELPSALESAEQIAARLKGKRPAMFLDYDGTLTPIVSQPEDAILSDSMRDVLRELAGLCTVAIVSGRDRADVEPLVALDGLIFAGSHGFDIKGPGLRMEYEGGKERLPDLAAAEQELHERIDPIAGARVERKRFAIANHYRNVADEDVSRVEQAVREVLAGHERLRLSHGKKVLELRPDIDWDKGQAVFWLLDALDLDGEDVLPFYLGDDVTDEDAFAVLSDHGIAVIVGNPSYKTNASYSLRNTPEVEVFLGQLVGYLRDE